jgi:caffeoyl-CoA O-methyltransferase
MAERRPSWAMGEITDPAVEDYMYSLLPERDAVLRQMEAEADRRHIPIVGPAVGRLLYQLARMIGARNVFEMGSAIGYSTIWWAMAVGDGGKVTYTDGDRGSAEEARRNFARAGVDGRVQVLVGDALELLSEQRGPFDIMFCDIDKEDYPRAFRLALPRLRRGGLLIADNALWNGKVARPADADAPTRGVLEFNRLLYASAELFTTILPLRDGVAVAMKI